MKNDNGLTNFELEKILKSKNIEVNVISKNELKEPN